MRIRKCCEHNHHFLSNQRASVITENTVGRRARWNKSGHRERGNRQGGEGGGDTGKGNRGRREHTSRILLSNSGTPPKAVEALR